MRLDEWQKFIESEFLDEQPALKEKAEVKVVKVPPTAEPPTPEPPKPVPPASVVRPPMQEKVTPSPIPIAKPPQQRSLWNLITGKEDEVPSFLQSETPEAKPNPVTPKPTQHIIDFFAKNEEETPAPRPKRVPTHRAPHAKNVRPQEVPDGLSAVEVWSQLPKHLNQLVQMGQRAEEEIAQYSYKRPFEEKRLELIERILNPVLTLEETARLLNVCPTTIRRYTNKGILTCIRKEPQSVTRGSSNTKETRQRRFRLSDILAFLEAQQSLLEADQQRDADTLHTPEPQNAPQQGSL